MKNLLIVLLFLSTVSFGQKKVLRDYGIEIGNIETGKYNAITDVSGVRVGHTTLIEDENIRTGVTAILPYDGNIFMHKVPAAIYIGNGFGKLTGYTQVEELGEIETPIVLTNTLSVPRAADALIDYVLSIDNNREFVRSVNPVVGETNDGSLNDIQGRHVTKEDVIHAIRHAASGVIEQGSVGAGTGTICFGYKGGIGTSSRVLPKEKGAYTVGVLVQTNYGGNLTIAGSPVGEELKNREGLNSGDGSCMVVVATDAPLTSRNLKRLAKRAMFGIARTGGNCSNGSGEYVIAFSTAEELRIPYHSPDELFLDGKEVRNDRMTPLFEAVIEATEEAIINSLFAAESMTGKNGLRIESLPQKEVVEIIKGNEVKPNILLINIDDLGWKDVGFMGTEYYETPNIDLLSRQGMVFTNGYAAAANCAPSRACLMTGKWTPRHGIYTVDSSERGDSKDRKLIPVQNTKTLSIEHEVFPEILRKKGYITCHAGKWHLSDNPLDYGFEVNIGGGHNGHPRSYYPPYRNVKIEKGENEYLTDLIMEKALEFMDTVSNPFFLYYSPYAVHTPIQPVDSLLPDYRDKAEWKGQNNPEYATMIENLDRNIGLLISKLRDRKLFSNTFIVFTSDNGGLYGITRQKPLRAGKGSYYEGGIREPFFMVWEGKIKADKRSDVPVTNMDVFPTLLSVAGIDYHDYPLDGADLLPLLKNESEPPERPLFWHFPVYLQAYNKLDNENRDPLFRTRPGSVVRKGDWKLHYYFEDNEMELYNLSSDIREQNNLIRTKPEKAEEMLGYLENWWKETNAPIPRALNPGYGE